MSVVLVPCFTMAPTPSAAGSIEPTRTRRPRAGPEAATPQRFASDSDRAPLRRGRARVALAPPAEYPREHD
jgi:hypothetical protein